MQRIGIAQLEGLGGAAGVAAHVRALVPGASSVEQAVREIIERVRAEGDEAVLAYTRRFDAVDGQPRPLVVAPEELDEAIKRLPLEVVAGLQVTIANVAQRGRRGRARGFTPCSWRRARRVVLREMPVASAAIYVPGGRAPYPSTVVMGVVTARAAGVLDVAVCAPPGADGQIDAAILGACRLCGVERVYRMGGAQAIAALAYGTETVARVDVVVGPGNLYVQEAKRQLSATVGIDGFAGPSDLLVVLGAEVGERDDAPRRAGHARAGRARRGQPRRRRLAWSPASAMRSLRALEQLDAERPTVGDGARSRSSTPSTPRARSRWPTRFAPEHLQLIGADVEALAPRVRSAGCLFVGAASATAFGDYVAGSNHILPTGGAARFASMLSPRHFRRRMAEVRVGPGGRPRSWRARARRSRARRALSGTRARWRRAWATISRWPASRPIEARRSSAARARPTCACRWRWKAPARARARRASAFSTTCSTCSRATAGSTSTSPSAATCRRARTTPPRTRRSCSARRSTRRSGDRSGIARYGSATVPMDEARASCAIDISGRPFTAFEAELPPGSTGGFEHELTEEFFRALANAAKLTLHLRVEAGSNAHHMIEAAFKAFARALREAVAIDPSESGVPSTKGTLTA